MTSRGILRAAAAAALLTAAAPGSAFAVDTLPQPAAQQIAWSACTPRAPGLVCGTLSVPRDYANPGGDRLTLALIKRQATEPGRRRGAIVLNPGGPGGSGVDFLRQAADLYLIKQDPVMQKLGRYHDLVSFDPRGVGGSAQVKCPAKSPFLEATERGATIASMTALATPFIAECAKQSGPLLGSISTADAARDLEQIRAALGEQKLNYLGYSYGTFLGATYLSFFPGSAGKIVLDGGVDPDQYANRPLESDLAQAAGTEAVFKRFLKATRSNPALGRSISLKAYRKYIARLEKKPQRVRGVRGVKRLTAEDVSSIVASVLPTRIIWPMVAVGLRDAIDGDAQTLGSIVATLNADDVQYEGERFAASLLAISGADRVAPISAVNDAWIGQLRAAAPDFDDTWIASLTMSLWPHPPGRFAGPWTYAAPAGALPALVVGTRFDPRTPYAGSVALRQQLGNARLITLEGEGHGAFNNGMSGGCVENHVLNYFNAGTVPADGATCKQVDDPLGLSMTANAARAAMHR